MSNCRHQYVKNQTSKTSDFVLKNTNPLSQQETPFSHDKWYDFMASLGRASAAQQLWFSSIICGVTTIPLGNPSCLELKLSSGFSLFFNYKPINLAPRPNIFFFKSVAQLYFRWLTPTTRFPHACFCHLSLSATSIFLYLSFCNIADPTFPKVELPQFCFRKIPSSSCGLQIQLFPNLNFRKFPSTTFHNH